MRCRPIRGLWLGLCACLCLAAPLFGADFDRADQVLILKGERKLLLLKGDRVLRTMDIALGFVPNGDKHEEGDFRTPEGKYRLTRRNAASDYFLSIKVSYPNDEDRQVARARGVDPGGQIMIHGQPNLPKFSEGYYQWTDWTEGCIALSNSDMVDVWLMTFASTPIEIRP